MEKIEFIYDDKNEIINQVIRDEGFNFDGIYEYENEKQLFNEVIGKFTNLGFSIRISIKNNSDIKQLKLTDTIKK